MIRGAARGVWVGLSTMATADSGGRRNCAGISRCDSASEYARQSARRSTEGGRGGALFLPDDAVCPSWDKKLYT
jgi:hypothetical protein